MRGTERLRQFPGKFPPAFLLWLVQIDASRACGLKNLTQLFYGKPNLHILEPIARAEVDHTHVLRRPQALVEKIAPTPATLPPFTLHMNDRIHADLPIWLMGRRWCLPLSEAT
jgi:hypothetical protein